MMPIHNANKAWRAAVKHQGGASLLLERASLFCSFPWSILVHVKINLRSLVLRLTASLTVSHIHGQHGTQEKEKEMKPERLESYILTITPYPVSI